VLAVLVSVLVFVSVSVSEISVCVLFFLIQNRFLNLFNILEKKFLNIPFSNPNSHFFVVSIIVLISFSL
jgi:hypothetical protein